MVHLNNLLINTFQTMFLNKKSVFREFPAISGIIIYAFYINWLSGSVGIIPIDSFGFLDTGFSILKSKLPIRDFWIFTGLLVDYMEAFFLILFGNNWNSHLFHASSMNVIASLSFYYFIRKIITDKKFSIFYSLSFATLCYPVSGTPFAYIHSYIFSIVAIFILILAIKNKNNIAWFALPIVCFLAFLSMQTPSAYIIFLIIIFSLFYFLKEKKINNLKYFLFGGFFCILFLFIYLILTKTPFENFLYQYILFPLTIGEGRLSSSETAYLSLMDQLNVKRIFGEFKFIHIFLIPLLIISIKNFKKNNFNMNILNITIILTTIAFIFNQLLTANQIYIFSLIPILAAVLHMNILNFDKSPKIILVILFIVLFATIKFHLRYNIDRKFHDLEHVDKSIAIDAGLIHKNLKGLKWISKFNQDPMNEINTIKKALLTIDNDKRKKILITHYQFFSTILNKDLNILNRWYLWDNNTHPTENHKYFEFYKKMINKNIIKNEIQVIYLLGQDNEILFSNIKNYFTEVCFKSKTLEEKRFSVHELISCKK